LIHHETPKGVAVARNAGLARARASWVAFLDDDDLWAPTKLARQLEAAVAGVNWVCVGAMVVDVGLNVVSCTRLPPESDVARLLSYNCIPGGGSGPMVRTAVAREVGGFDPQLAILADWDMWIRLFLHSAPAYVDRPLMAYLRHYSSMSHRNDGFSAELERMVGKYGEARRTLGIEVERDRWLKWVAAMQVRLGHRREAVQIYLHLIHRYHDGKSIARAALTSLLPGLVVRYWRWHLRRMVPAEWYGDAQRWLAPIRANEPLRRATASAA
jgi:glycosyltransferase involved in cell wall biosynthesis